jgi:hypothetical protein
MTRKELEAKCPDGYSINDIGPKNMLGATELWRIFENHCEPDLTRIPQDLVDYGIAFGKGRGPKRVPDEWGRCLYYKVV